MSLMKDETHLDLKTYIFHYPHLSSRIIFTLLYVVSQISLNLFMFSGFLIPTCCQMEGCSLVCQEEFKAVPQDSDVLMYSCCRMFFP